MKEADMARNSWRDWVGDYVGLLVALASLIAIFGLLTDHFLSVATFRTIANQVPSAIIVATGMTWVLVIGEIDLSVGSVLGLVSAVLGVALAQWQWPPAAAMIAAVLAGLLCGAFNGLVSMRWRLPSFIVTLGMLEIARGGAHWIAQSRTQYVGGALERVSETSLGGLSLPFVLAVLIVIAAQAVLTRTVPGRTMVAIGTNAEAVRLCGIDPRPVKLAVFLTTGALVALAGIIDTGRFQSANPNMGIGSELQAIAAAVIGGTSLMGGRGSVLRTFFGVLIIAVLNSGLASAGARDETKRIVTGLVIVGAVIVDHYRARMDRRSREV